MLNRFNGIPTKIITGIICALFLLSCHSGNNVVSSYGKRKYTKGWFLFRHGEVETKGGKGKDTGLTHKYTVETKPGKKEEVQQEQVKGQEEGTPKKHRHHHANKDSLRAAAKIASAAAAAAKNKTKPPPEPPDGFTMQILILIMVLTALFILITGLITPILVWGITQDFLLIVGVAFLLIALLLSINTQLGINKDHAGEKVQYNIGKPAWTLALLAALPVALLYFTVKGSVTAFYQIATIGMFIAAACIIVSLVLAVKALFVHDRHPGKAVVAILIDALLIAIAITLLP